MVWLKALHRNMTRRHFFLVSILMVVFMLFVLPAEAGHLAELTDTTASPDTRLFYTPEALYEIAEDYGADGRTAYIWSRIRFDIVWPLIYGAFLVFGLALVFDVGGKRSLLLGLPMLAVAFDFMENIWVSIVFARYPQTLDLLAWMASFSTFFKWLFIATAFIMLAFGFLYRIMRIRLK